MAQSTGRNPLYLLAAILAAILILGMIFGRGLFHGNPDTSPPTGRLPSP